MRVKLDFYLVKLILVLIPLRAKQVREVTNLTERKNPRTPVHGVKEFVCLSVCPSVCLWQTLTPIISGLAEQYGLKNNLK